MIMAPGWFRGWNTSQLCRNYFISYYKDAYKPTRKIECHKGFITAHVKMIEFDEAGEVVAPITAAPVPAVPQPEKEVPPCQT